MSQHQRREAMRRRLAALGALTAAGVAVAGGQEAQADIIVVDVNEDFGFAPGDTPFDFFDLPGGAGFLVATTTFTFAGLVSHSLVVVGTNFYLKTQPFTGYPFALPLDAGVKWDTAPGNSHFYGYLAFVSSGGNVAGPGAFTDKYFAFRFTVGGEDRFGWIQGSLTDTTFDGLTYHFTRYAYEDTGVMIATGQVPEPAAVGMSLLGGVLVTGAAGVRRWKKAKGEAA